jgi:hypothetical protein
MSILEGLTLDLRRNTTKTNEDLLLLKDFLSSRFVPMKELWPPESLLIDCIKGFQGEPAVSAWSAFHVRLTTRPLAAHGSLASRHPAGAGGGAGRRTEARGRSELL